MIKLSEESDLTQPTSNVIEEEKKKPYVTPPPYKSPIQFPQISAKVEIEGSFKKFVICASSLIVDLGSCGLSK